MFLRQERTAKLSRCLLQCTGNDPGSPGMVCILRKSAGIAHEWTGAESREIHKASSPVSFLPTPFAKLPLECLQGRTSEHGEVLSWRDAEHSKVLSVWRCWCAWSLLALGHDNARVALTCTVVPSCSWEAAADEQSLFCSGLLRAMHCVPLVLWGQRCAVIFSPLGCSP